MSELAYKSITEGERDALGDVLSHAFGFPREDAGAWFDRAGLTNVRVLRRGERVVGGLLRIPMGQYFGGASVSTMGVAGVGISPDERGAGAARAMMTAMLREARAEGFALSTLYPATVTLYQRVGYERAGSRFGFEIDPRACAIDRPEGVRVVGSPGDSEALRAVYHATARKSPGALDRGPYVWTRVFAPRGKVTKTFLVEAGGAVEGYAVLSHKMTEMDVTVLEAVDLAATTARAAKAVLRTMMEYRSLSTCVRWHGGLSDVFAMLLPERNADVRLRDHFMVRVLDPKHALEGRGYPHRADVSFVMALDDASLPENSGVYTVRVADGRAHVEVGASAGAPRATISERGLAALYTGHATPRVLGQAGVLEAGEEAAEVLESCFGGAAPAMRDMF